MVCTQQIQFWKIAAVPFGILYILCTLNGVLRLILGDRFLLMCRSWYSGLDLIKFQGQSKLFSHIFFCVFSGIIRPLRPKKKNMEADRQAENFPLPCRVVICPHEQPRFGSSPAPSPAPSPTPKAAPKKAAPKAQAAPNAAPLQSPGHRRRPQLKGSMPNHSLIFQPNEQTL